MQIDPIPKNRLWVPALQIVMCILTVVLGFLYLSGRLQGMLYVVLLAALATGGVCCIPYHPAPKQKLSPQQEQANRLLEEERKRRIRNDHFNHYRD